MARALRYKSFKGHYLCVGTQKICWLFILILTKIKKWFTMVLMNVFGNYLLKNLVCAV